MIEFIGGMVVMLLWLLFIFFTFMVADGRGRNPFLWAALGLFFPVLSLVTLLLLPSRHDA